MAKGGMVQHWKHGWIPVSPEAKAFVAGKGPRPASRSVRAQLPHPGDKDYSPNNEFGLPTMHVRGDKAGGERRVADIREIVPDISPEPHYQFSSQSMAAHYTGGVVIGPHDMDVLLDKLTTDHEGTASRLDVAEASGAVGNEVHRLTTNTAKGNPEEQAKRRARRLKSYLGMEYGGLPHYQKVAPGFSVGGTSGYTGGVVFDGPTADELVRKLNDAFTGTSTHFAARRAGGFA